MRKVEIYQNIMVKLEQIDNAIKNLEKQVANFNNPLKHNTAVPECDDNNPGPPKPLVDLDEDEPTFRALKEKYGTITSYSSYNSK